MRQDMTTIFMEDGEKLRTLPKFAISGPPYYYINKAKAERRRRSNEANIIDRVHSQMHP